MTTIIDTLGRTARRTAMLTVPLLVAATGTAAAHGGYGGGMMGGYGGSTMGGGGWGLFGGTMGLFGILWMVLLLAVPAYFVYALVTRESSDKGTRPLSVLQERYARGELSDEEFERRRAQLERSG